jgi:hypothetical protein
MALIYLFIGISIFCVLTIVVMEIYSRFFSNNEENDEE